jgi:hypothetical protein
MDVEERERWSPGASAERSNHTISLGKALQTGVSIYRKSFMRDSHIDFSPHRTHTITTGC